MSNNISIVSPIHFPQNQSLFASKTHAQIACDCFPNDFVQKFHCTDTIYFYLQTSHLSAVPRIYILDEDGVRLSGPIAGNLINGNRYYIELDLSSYCDQYISVEYAEFLAFVETTIDTSNQFLVTSSFECVDCARLITYDGDCEEFGTYYGETAGSPLFTHQLRLDASFDLANEVFSGEYFKDSLGVYDSCGIELDEVWRLSISFVPSWMKRKLMYIFRSKRVYIDGTRFVPEGPLNTGQTSGSLSEVDILLKPAQSLATITGCC